MPTSKPDTVAIQPFFTYLLGGGWSCTLTSESTHNWEGDTDEWVVPVALGVSKVVKMGGKYFSLGASMVSYVEKPDSMQDWETRLSITYVFR